MMVVRHCHHDLIGRILVGRKPNVSLSAAGTRQAQRLATVLVRRGVADVKSSPQLRARQTAEPLAAMLGKPVEIIPEFDEADFGAWRGRAFDSLQDYFDWQRLRAVRGTCRAPG